MLGGSLNFVGKSIIVHTGPLCFWATRLIWGDLGASLGWRGIIYVVSLPQSCWGSMNDMRRFQVKSIHIANMMGLWWFKEERNMWRK